MWTYFNLSLPSFELQLQLYNYASKMKNIIRKSNKFVENCGVISN